VRHVPTRVPARFAHRVHHRAATICRTEAGRDARGPVPRGEAATVERDAWRNRKGCPRTGASWRGHRGGTRRREKAGRDARGPKPHATTRVPRVSQATARPILGVPLKFRGNVPILDLSGFL
jgi:hypothetical protein